MLKINIATWESEVAQQFQIRALHTYLLYNGYELEESDFPKIMEFLHQLPDE